MIKTLEDFQLNDILPDSLKDDPDVLAIAVGLTDVFKEIYRNTQLVKFHEGIADNLLDFIAYEEGVIYYDENLTVEQKRELIERAPYIHKLKGTVAAVEQAVSIFFKNANVVEWFDYDGDPFNFQIEIKSSVIKAGELEKLHKLVNAAKNLRSRLEFVILRIFEGNIGIKSSARAFEVPYPITNQFHTATVKGKLAKSNLTVSGRTRVITIEYPITNILMTPLRFEKQIKSNITGTATVSQSKILYKNSGENYAGEVEL